MKLIFKKLSGLLVSVLSKDLSGNAISQLQNFVFLGEKNGALPKKNEISEKRAIIVFNAALDLKIKEEILKVAEEFPNIPIYVICLLGQNSDVAKIVKEKPLVKVLVGFCLENCENLIFELKEKFGEENVQAVFASFGKKFVSRFDRESKKFLKKTSPDKF